MKSYNGSFLMLLLLLKFREKAKQKMQEAAKLEQQQLRSYTSLMSESNMTSNKDDPIDEDDFM